MSRGGQQRPGQHALPPGEPSRDAQHAGRVACVPLPLSEASSQLLLVGFVVAVSAVSAVSAGINARNARLSVALASLCELGGVSHLLIGRDCEELAL